MSDDRFGDVRSLLQQAPSPQHWRALCQAVAEWDGPEFEERVLPYILDGLASWPLRLRRAPMRWLDGLARGARLPWAPMVKVLDLTDFGLRNEDMHTLAHAPALEHLEVLILDGNDIGIKGVRYLSESPEVRSLRVLSLQGARVDAEGARAITATPYFASLERLVLRDAQLHTEAVEYLAHTDQLHALRELDLSHNGMRHKAAEVLAR
ncbi:MAG: hypothetical protein AAGI01_04235, partial [Myxococcota bacterium]